MHSESHYNSLIVKALRQRLPHGVVFKLADTFTTGVPDIVVSLNRRTSWFEAKIIDSKWIEGDYVTVKPKEHVPAVQWETLRILGGHLIAYTSAGHGVTLVSEHREITPVFKLRLMSLKDLVHVIIEICKGDKL